MSTPEKRAEESIDLLEKHVGGFMPDTEYEIQVEPETSLNDYELGDSFEVNYRLEASVSSDSGTGEWEFKGSHLIHGTEAEVRSEYEALVSELETRFQVSDLDYPDWEVIE